MRQIFMSYAQNDETFAIRLTEDLRSSGAKVWLDVHNAEPGRNWGRSIERALSESGMMVVVLSPQALECAHIAVEWQAYLEARRPMIPVVVRSCDLPGPLRTRRPVDFTWDYSRAFHQLVSRLLEYNARGVRGDPVIWTMAEEVQEFRSEQPAPVAASALPDPVLDDLTATGIKRMVSGLRDMLRRHAESDSLRPS